MTCKQIDGCPFFFSFLFFLLFFFWIRAQSAQTSRAVLPKGLPPPHKHTHAHTSIPTLLLWVLTQLTQTHTHTTDTHSTHILAPLHPLAQKIQSPYGHMHTQTAHTHTFPHSEGLRAHWGKSSSNAAHLPVARKRRVASRSWGDILTFISLSVGLKAEKSCFLSRWVIFFFVLLSAEEGKFKVKGKTQTSTFAATEKKGQSIPLHRHWASRPGS